MWDNIREQIEDGNYACAREIIDKERRKLQNYDDTFAILEASLCEAEHNREGMFDAIAKGLYYNPENYELYYMLGRFYYDINTDQAFLCFQNALFYCRSSEDSNIIRNELDNLRYTHEITVKNTTIIIASYNSCYLLQKNIESIRNTLLDGTYRVVIVDNASDDGVVEWLERQSDIILIKNKENKGFPCACNQGARAVRKPEFEESDIFLLNNDTRLAINSLFWLRMGLYADTKTGAAGSCSNYSGNEQQLDITFSLPEEYLTYGAKLNIPLQHPCEERVRLSGFAMLVKGCVWDALGGMDEQFTPGYFEDDDLCMRILKLGYRIQLCRNSFIYHAGSQSFSHENNVNEVLLAHQQLFIQKYGFDILEYATPDRDLLAGIPYSADDEFNILQVGSGLGADLKLLRTLYPQAHIVGIETNELLSVIAGGTEAIFGSAADMAEIFRNPVFDVLIVNSREYRELSENDRIAITGLCKRDCVILPKKNPYMDFTFDKIKLIIWDLDDTFWQGILSEGEIVFSRKNIQLIKNLADCGIINSISSKNDSAEVNRILAQLKLDDFFVFNNINWEDKGGQIKQKLSDMGLRTENTLFIDDNTRNLEEVKYLNKGIMTASPEIIPYLANYVYRLPILDMGHKRLIQYKILEEKVTVRKQYDSKEAFLADSDIKVTLGKDCLNKLDRIEELVARTNQLNFTKQRSGREELLRMISDDWMDSGYVSVTDKYGDYGIVGFYCYNRRERRMEHFLFSCRILGMRVEQYVYGKIGFPEINIVQPVAGILEKNVIVPWIRESKNSGCSTGPLMDNRIKILLKGPCDMSAIESYLIGGKITTEFNFVNSEGFITAGQNHSMHIWESAHCSKAEIKGILAEAPFIRYGDFETMLFQKEYHIVCYSLLPDCHSGLYRNKKSGLYVSFGSVNFNLTDDRNRQGYIDGTIVNHAFPFTEEIIEDFSKNWEFVGTTPEDMMVRNLEYMYFNAPGNPVFVLLLGSEIEYEGDNPEFAGHAKRHKKVNQKIKAFADGKKRIKLVNITDFVHSQEDYEDSINHLSRKVYYNLATAVCSCINDVFG